MNRKKILIAAAVAGLMASSSIAMAGSAFPGHDSGNKSRCDMNGCKGKASCKGGKNAFKAKCNFSGSSKVSAKAEDGKLTAK